MSTIGRYEIEAEIGRGSMGTVYRAYDARLRRRVALKTYLLPQGISDDEGRLRRERFIREAQAAGALSHPGIVTIFEVDEDPRLDVPFIAMEYVPGRSLREVLAAEGPLPRERLLAMAATLAGALHCAHEAGIVHRDVKPANVLVREPDGAVKIADFGVARTPTSELTQSGASIGSPAYMPPEQFRGEPADGRSDLFSLGVILYEALCGARPFAGSDVPSIAYSVVHEEPRPVTGQMGELPVELDRFFERALAKDPADRFQTGAELAAALEHALFPAPPATAKVPAGLASGNRVTATDGGRAPENDDLAPPGSGGRRRTLQVVGAAALIVVVLGAWAVLRGRDGDAARPAGSASEVTASAPARAHDASLELVGRSSVKSGSLVILVDGAEVYSRALSTEQRTMNRFFKKVSGRVSEEFEATIPVSAGEHEIVARVHFDGKDIDEEQRITVEVEPGDSLRVHVVAGRTFGRPLALQAG